MRELVAFTVDDIEKNNARMVIFNGFLSGLVHFPQVVARLALDRHLIVADDVVADCFERELKPIQIMVVSQIEGKQSLIHVEFMW